MSDDNEASIFDDVVRDPKQERYEGDLKAELVKVILEHRHELGTPSYRLVERDPTWPVQSQALVAVPQPLNLTDHEIEDIVDRKVTQLIGELLEFDHRYNSEFASSLPPRPEGESKNQGT